MKLITICKKKKAGKHQTKSFKTYYNRHKFLQWDFEHFILLKYKDSDLSYNNFQPKLKYDGK